MAVATRTRKPLDVPRTGTGHVKMPKLDLAGIDTTETESVTDTLNRVKDPKAALAAAARIQHEAEGLIAARQPYLYVLGLSIALYDGGRAVYDAMGISRAFFTLMTNKALGDWDGRKGATPDQVKERARARKVRYYRNAPVELPGVAAEVAGAKARIAAVLPIRDAIMVGLREQGMTRREIAGIIGRAPSRVSHIVNPKTAGADTEDEV